MLKLARKVKKIWFLTILMCLGCSFMVQAKEELKNDVIQNVQAMKVKLPEPDVRVLEETQEDLHEMAVLPDYEGSEVDLMMDLCQQIKEALLGGARSINLRENYKISYITYGDVGYVRFLCPYLGDDIKASFFYFSGGENVWAKMELTTNLSQAEINQRIENVDDALEEIFASVNEDMSEVEKLLTVHDYICGHASYDYATLQDSENQQETRYDPFCSYGLLMNHTGVCNGYAYLYMYCMNHLGVETVVNESRSMNHAWNVVKTNGNYYQVDCTWDDPLGPKNNEVYYGGAEHRYFMVSDEAFQSSGTVRQPHHDYSIQGKCTDKSYDQYFWLDITSPIVVNQGNYYYISDRKVIKRTAGEIQELDTIDAWKIWGEDEYFWPISFADIFLYQGKLYYNTPTEIKCYDLETQTAQTFETIDTTDGYVYGIVRNGEMVDYAIRTSYENPVDVKSMQLLEVHRMKKIEKKEATCVADGNIEYYRCSSCKKYFKDASGNEEIQENSWIIPMVEHSWESTYTEDVAATCTKDGSKSIHCANCEATKDATVILKTGHPSMEKIEKKAATCLSDGNKEYYSCPDCENYFEDADGNKEIPKDSWIIQSIGHYWYSTYMEDVAATCAEDGSKSIHCAYCEATKDPIVIPKKGHPQMTKIEKKDATCEKNGNIEYYRCSECGNSYKDASGKEEINAQDWVIKAKGHQFGEWKTVVSPTVFVKQVQERSCDIDSEVEQRTLAKLTPTIKLSATSKKIKKKKKFTLVVSELAKGDYVKSIKSTKTKVASVTAKGVVKGKKKGTTDIVVTLASGKVAKCKVKVK